MQNFEDAGWLISTILVDLGIAILAIFALRQIFGLVSGVNTRDELAKKDNFAFGITFAGGAWAMAMVVAAAVTGQPDASLLAEIMNVTVYALTGIVLFKLGAWINDRFLFNQFSMKQQISDQNMSIGVVQAANYLALGLIISAAINWVETEQWQGISYVIVVFIAMQLVLLLVTRIRGLIYSQRHVGEQLQIALRDGNVALSIRYAGHLIAVAIGVSGVATLVEYRQFSILMPAFEWLFYAVIITLVISLLAALARRVVLSGIDIVAEVDEQHNIGVAAIEAAIYLVIALVLQPLLVLVDQI